MLSVIAVCVTLQSMLASCKVRSLSVLIVLVLCANAPSWIAEEREVAQFVSIQMSGIAYASMRDRPQDDARYVRTAPENPKRVRSAPSLAAI